mmetsp:Transcript_53081/g.113351  ORF Transcript_53081/g.113351 Transcript_53081/m.113351 type:complete len:431 (-) Transcript_53081:916-2208(-)
MVHSVQGLELVLVLLVLQQQWEMPRQCQLPRDRLHALAVPSHGSLSCGDGFTMATQAEQPGLLAPLRDEDAQFLHPKILAKLLHAPLAVARASPKALPDLVLRLAQIPSDIGQTPFLLGVASTEALELPLQLLEEVQYARVLVFLPPAQHDCSRLVVDPMADAVLSIRPARALEKGQDRLVRRVVPGVATLLLGRQVGRDLDLDVLKVLLHLRLDVPQISSIPLHIQLALALVEVDFQVAGSELAPEAVDRLLDQVPFGPILVGRGAAGQPEDPLGSALPLKGLLHLLQSERGVLAATTPAAEGQQHHGALLRHGGVVHFREVMRQVEGNVVLDLPIPKLLEDSNVPEEDEAHSLLEVQAALQLVLVFIQPLLSQECLHLVIRPLLRMLHLVAGSQVQQGLPRFLETLVAGGAEGGDGGAARLGRKFQGL